MNGSLADIVSRHAGKYPEMRPCDAVKLIYQNEFGNGHMVGDEQLSLQLLADEFYNTNKTTGQTLFENIGNRYCRLNIAALEPSRVPLSIVNKIFCASAIRSGALESFNLKLNLLTDLASRGLFNFSKPDVLKYIDKYPVKSVIPRHSDEYRKAYTPAYRVVDSSYAELFGVITAIERLLKKGRTVIAIDGKSASGKTKAASYIKNIYKCAVIHMDDFFMPSHMRGDKNWKEPGGNIDYDRFNMEVSSAVRAGGDIFYKKYDCASDSFSTLTRKSLSNLIIVEGAYSTHPDIQINYGAKIFFDIDDKNQRERVIKRNGIYGARAYFDEWIPRENRYIDKFLTKENCGISVFNFGVDNI